MESRTCSTASTPGRRTAKGRSATAFSCATDRRLGLESGDESLLDSHRREIVVVFCDLRGFTRSPNRANQRKSSRYSTEYHAALGDLVFRFEGTLERFTGDGVMVFFNDPMPCADAPLRAVRMAVAMRSRIRELAEAWAGAARPRPRHRRRPGIRDAGPDRIRGPPRLRRDR